VEEILKDIFLILTTIFTFLTSGLIPVLFQIYRSHKKEKEAKRLKELEQDRKINKLIYQNEKLGDIIGIYISNNGASKETKKIVEKLLQKIKEN
jgi:low temperature requirement protein LtrA